MKVITITFFPQLTQAMTRSFSQTRTRRSTIVNRKTASLGAGGGCLLAAFGFFAWAVCALISLAISIGSICLVISGVYWVFTQEWIGNAPFLN